MSDDLRIPQVGPEVELASRDRARMPYAPVSNGPFLASQLSNSSYRARRPGPEAVQPMLKLAAAGLGGLLLLGAVGYGVMGRRPSTIPVIEADSRPLKVKPDNPGGMQVAGADELSDDRSSSDKMAPTAEVPAPQALRAQMQQGAPAAPATAGPAATAATTGPAVALQPGVVPAPGTPKPAASATVPGASPLPDTPVKAGAKPVAPAPAATVAASTTPVPGIAPAAPAPAAATAAMTTPVTATAAVPHPGGGVTLVQLGALASEAAARTEWQRLGRSAPGLLDGREPVVSKVERDGRIYWRLRTGGFSDIADATGFCAKLKAKGASCAIADF